MLQYCLSLNKTENFDLIVCRDMLSSIEHPKYVLDRLRQMLNPDGGMVVSFMGVEGNEAISELRKLILMLSMHGDKVLTDEERIYFTRELVHRLPKSSRVKQNEGTWNMLSQALLSPIPTFNLVFPPPQYVYSVNQVHDIIHNTNGLRVAGFGNRGLYDPFLWLSEDKGGSDLTNEHLKLLFKQIESLGGVSRMRWAEILHGISERHLVFIRHVGTNAFIQPPKVAAESVPCLIRPFVSGTWSMQPSVNGDADFVTVSREMDSTIASGPCGCLSEKSRKDILPCPCPCQAAVDTRKLQDYVQ